MNGGALAIAGCTFCWRGLTCELQEALPDLSRRGLTICKHGGWKRAIGTRAPMAIPQGPSQ